jgi:hypothetical protein
MMRDRRLRLQYEFTDDRHRLHQYMFGLRELVFLVAHVDVLDLWMSVMQCSRCCSLGTNNSESIANCVVLSTSSLVFVNCLIVVSALLMMAFVSCLVFLPFEQASSRAAAVTIKKLAIDFA